MRDPLGVRSFVQRDWRLVAATKHAHWAALSAADALRAAEALRKQVQAMRPDWPTEAMRAEDLAAHQRLSERLRRGSPRT